MRNDGAGVIATVNGKNWPKFKTRLPLEAPRLARIDAIEDEPAEVSGEGFVILDSESPARSKPPSAPTPRFCPECVAEIFDPTNRRWRYAFTTCTHCGPRYTVSRQHSLRPGANQPRRLSALRAVQATNTSPRATVVSTPKPPAVPIAARNCACFRPTDRRWPAKAPSSETLRLLRDGKIVAIKGLGGFHLACDARNATAVAELRERKQREEKALRRDGSQCCLAGRICPDWRCRAGAAAQRRRAHRPLSQRRRRTERHRARPRLARRHAAGYPAASAALARSGRPPGRHRLAG